MEASIWHRIETVKYLVETAVADIQVQNKEGKTAMDLAKESPFRGREPVVTYFESLTSA